MHQITIQEARSHIGGVLDDVLRGEEIIITDHDTPVARVVPIENHPRLYPLFGAGKDSIAFIADNFNETPEDFKNYLQ